MRVTFLLLLLLLTACQSMQLPDRSTMAMGFAEAVYGLGIEPEGRHTVITQSHLLRWERGRPVLLVFRGASVDDAMRREIAGQLRALYAEAGLELRTEGSISTQLLRLTVRDEKLIIDEQIKTTCFTRFDYIRKGYLRTVDIVATRAALEDESDNCLIHEGMHSLGFAGHPHRLDSVLSYTRDQRELSSVDRRLIALLYSDELDQSMSPGDALTVAYSHLDKLRETSGRRYVPRDISLELREEESPLVLKRPFLGGASKQFYFQSWKTGSRTTNASYGFRMAGESFADVTYTALSNDRIFGEQWSLDQYVESYAEYLGPAESRRNGFVDHPLGRFEYALVYTPRFSCAFTIKYFRAEYEDIGGHELIYGSFCTPAETPIGDADARQFVTAIEVLDRDPIALRERRVSERGNRREISALRLTGQWPVDGSRISGLKLIRHSRTSGRVVVTVRGERCEGVMSNIGSNGLGQWTLRCSENESAEGRFSWDRDGSVSFRGQTTLSGGEIRWTGYPVF